LAAGTHAVHEILARPAAHGGSAGRAVREGLRRAGAAFLTCEGVESARIQCPYVCDSHDIVVHAEV